MQQLILFDTKERGNRTAPFSAPRWQSDRAQRPADGLKQTVERGRDGFARTTAAPGGVEAEKELILAVMHTTDAQAFREGLRQFMTEEEKAAMAAAKALSLNYQIMHLLDRVTRRLTLRWASLSDWDGLAEIVAVETIRAGTRCILLDMGVRGSRGLKGQVVFRIATTEIREYRGPIPMSAIQLLLDTNWFVRLAVIEPLFGPKNGVITSMAQARKLLAKPVDPLIIGYLGPQISVVSKELAGVARKERKWGPIFICAHWDEVASP
jgi:hypothetical protein